MSKEDWTIEFDENEENIKSNKKNYKLEKNKYLDAVQDHLITISASILIIGIIIILLGKSYKTEIKLSKLESKFEQLEKSQGKRLTQAYSQEIIKKNSLKNELQALSQHLEDLTVKVSNLQNSYQNKISRLQNEFLEFKQNQIIKQGKSKNSKQQTSPHSLESRTIKTYKVQKGDNLYRIGLKYDITVERLRQINNLGPNEPIYPGQKLLLQSLEQ